MVSMFFLCYCHVQRSDQLFLPYDAITRDDLVCVVQAKNKINEHGRIQNGVQYVYKNNKWKRVHMTTVSGIAHYKNSNVSSHNWHTTDTPK